MVRLAQVASKNHMYTQSHSEFVTKGKINSQGLRPRRGNSSANGKRDSSKDSIRLMVPKNGHWRWHGIGIRQSVLVYQNAESKPTVYLSKLALAVQYSVSIPSEPSSEWAKDKIRRVQAKARMGSAHRYLCSIEKRLRLRLFYYMGRVEGLSLDVL